MVISRYYKTPFKDVDDLARIDQQQNERRKKSLMDLINP